MEKDFLPQIDLNKYSYELPQDRIALYPSKDRASGRLIVANKRNESIEHSKFGNLIDFLPENSFLVMNKTKVIAARFRMRKPGGGKAELLLVEPVEPSNDPQVAMQAKGASVWKCIVGGKRIRPGSVLKPEEDEDAFMAEVLEKDRTEALVKLEWEGSSSLAGLIGDHGITPLPPYIKREAEESDKDRYQTVYASVQGSVAAPTAGLHFTGEILHELKMKGIGTEEVLLHVGPGTFRPIDAPDVRGHEMHKEQIMVSRASLVNVHKAIEDRKKIVATGTTTVRTLESLYWFGADMIANQIREPNFFLHQWFPYALAQKDRLPEAAAAFSVLIEYLDMHEMDMLAGRTQLFIMPGYEFRIVDAMITNFHMPRSTLILLVAAFIGDDLWRRVYESAMAEGYRFLSYGDSSLLVRNP